MTARKILTSHSIDNLFDYCARKFELTTMYDKRPARDSGFAASVGTALHDATQAWCIARAELLSSDECMVKGYMALMKSYPWEMEMEQTQQTRGFGQTVALFEQIVRQKFWNDWELVRVDNHGWAIEVPFLIQHTSLGEFYMKNVDIMAVLATQGKIDFVMRHVRTGAIGTFDLKTTIIDPDMAEPEYKFSGQQIGYSNVVQAMLGELQGGFMVHYIAAHFMGNDPPYVQLLPLNMTQDLIDDYWMSKLDRMNRIKVYAEYGWFPRTNGGCHGYGHRCAFFDICPSRDYDLINRWFEGINAEPQAGYDYWVTMEV